MRIESNRVSPLVSDEVDGSRTSLHVMPRIWHAAMNERNVRVDGCVKYSIARLWWSRLMRKSCPPRLFDRTRILSAVPARSSSRSTENCRLKMTCRSRSSRLELGDLDGIGRSMRLW